MCNVILSGGEKAGVNIRGNSLPEHGRLRGLDYEASGHTGFQKEMTEEQLAAIADVSNKEDKENKAQNWLEDNLTAEKYPSMELTDARFKENEEILNSVAWDVWGNDGKLETEFQRKEEKVTSISASSTDEQYPSAKAVNDRIVAKADWELVETATIAEDVTEIVRNLSASYKELFWVFKVPTINPDKTSDFPKGRMMLYSNGNTLVALDPDYGISDTGNEWFLSYHMQMLGEHCSVFKACKDPATQITESAYIQYPPFYQKDVGWQPGKDIGSKSMSYLKLNMLCATSGARYFPAGTKYELWGVKA